MGKTLFASLVIVFLLTWAALPSGAEDDWYSYEGYRLSLPQPEMGCPFPDYSLPNTEGTEVRFSDFTGDVIILAFCSCYTDTCCAIIDALEDLKSAYAGEGLVTLIVCSEIAPELAKEGYAGILGQCSEAADVVLIDTQRKAKGRFEVRKLPTTFLVDANFCTRSRATSVGALYTKEFRRRLQEVLAERRK